MGRDYKKIVAWQRAHEVTLHVYRLTKGFPRDERFGITPQVRRSACGVAANIAEGSGRGTKKDYLNFLHIAMGSLKETEYFLLLARDLGYIERDEHELVVDKMTSAFAALAGLIVAVRKETEAE